MNWLIVEDALKNRKGHWFEYIESFRKGLEDLGNNVTVLADRTADDFISQKPGIKCVLPESIWDRMGDNASRLTRYLRVPLHGYHTLRAMKRWFKSNAPPDIIFVPTVLVHHLIGWWPIYRSILRYTDTKLLLFFPNTPLSFDDHLGEAILGRDPSARLFGYMIRKFSEGVKSGQVILGAETHEMREAMTRVTGVKFTYLPHPVDVSGLNCRLVAPGGPLHFACYGAARYEKGSDLLQAAIRKHFYENPQSTSRFSIQWLSDFTDPQGKHITPDSGLALDNRVTYIRDYFDENGYEDALETTDIMLLPYREPYRYRVSRVVIEAMVRGMPVVTSRGTTLWEQSSKFGAAVSSDLNSVDSLASAIKKVELEREELLSLAEVRVVSAREHFSVKQFVQLIDALPNDGSLR